MKTETMNDRAQLFGRDYLLRYARSRRAAAWVLAGFCLLFLAAAQVLTWFVARRAGHADWAAVVLAAVPFVGPAVLCVQTAIAGGGTEFLRPLALFGALLPAVLFLLLGAHCHDLRKRALCVLAERDEAAAALAQRQAAKKRIAAAPVSVIVRPGADAAAPLPAKATPAAREEAAPRPAAVRPAAAPARPADSRPAESARPAAVKPASSVLTAAAEGGKAESGSVPSPLQKAQEEYNRAMQDVLAFLKKK